MPLQRATARTGLSFWTEPIRREQPVELREWSRIDEELKVERIRLTNRLRDQLWRYYPQMPELGDLDEGWMLDLWEAAPTPEKASARLKRLLLAFRRNTAYVVSTQPRC